MTSCFNSDRNNRVSDYSLQKAFNFVALVVIYVTYMFIPPYTLIYNNTQIFSIKWLLYIIIWCCIWLGIEIGWILLVTLRYLHFNGLKVILHLLAHSSRVDKPVCYKLQLKLQHWWDGDNLLSKIYTPTTICMYKIKVSPYGGNKWSLLT